MMTSRLSASGFWTKRKHEALRAVLYRTTMLFLVLHEWTHHVHRHFADDLDRQAQELDADGFAANTVLINLIDGDARAPYLRLLGKKNEPENVQNEALIACFVTAVCAFFFSVPSTVVDARKIDKETHPPQAARLWFLLMQVMGWCKRHQPAIDGWMTLDWNQEQFMRQIGDATKALNGGKEWTPQHDFLKSPDGIEYMTRLDERRAAHVRSLRPPAA
jgi:hypothetical protein